MEEMRKLVLRQSATLQGGSLPPTSESSSPDFEHILKKELEEIPGINTAMSEVLKRKGFNMASMVLGKFLLFKKNEIQFKQWLHETADATIKQQDKCFNYFYLQTSY